MPRCTNHLLISQRPKAIESASHFLEKNLPILCNHSMRFAFP